MLDELKKITSPDDNGWPIPLTGGKRIGVGLRSKTTMCLERVLGVKKVLEEPEDEDEDVAESTTASSIGASKLANTSVPAHIQASFNHFDVDSTGNLDYKELRNTLHFYGLDVTHPAAAEIIAKYDDHPDGRMQLGEFAELVANMEHGMVRLAPPSADSTSQTSPAAAPLVTPAAVPAAHGMVESDSERDNVPFRIKMTFDKFDVDGNGVFDYKELRNALKAMGYDTSDACAAKYVECYDDQPDGTMQLEEFAQLVADLDQGLTRVREAQTGTRLTHDVEQFNNIMKRMTHVQPEAPMSDLDGVGELAWFDKSITRIKGMFSPPPSRDESEDPTDRRSSRPPATAASHQPSRRPATADDAFTA